MRRLLWKLLFVGALTAAAVGLAQKVDQGKPGTQGPWPVTGTVIVVNVDGGSSTFTFPAACSQLVPTNDAGIGTSASRVPPSGPRAGRIWIRVCNDLVNSGSTQCRCSTTQCPVATTGGNVGDLLATGDCVTYNIGVADAGVPCCVCNGAGSWLPTIECIP